MPSRVRHILVGERRGDHWSSVFGISFLRTGNAHPLRRLPQESIEDDALDIPRSVYVSWVVVGNAPYLATLAA